MVILHKIFKLGFLHLILILLWGCNVKYHPTRTNTENIEVKQSSDTSSFLITEKFLTPYKQALKDSFSTKIATATNNLVKRRPSGGSLGNMITAAIEAHELQNKNIEDPTLILMNYGGIRVNEITKGDITIGKIYELLPFENTLVRIKINGATLAAFIEIVNKSGGWPCRFVRNDRFASPITQQDKIFSLENIAQMNKEFILITNNYIAAGGDNATLLKTLPQEDTGILLRDIVINYMRKQKIITPDDTDYILK